MRRTDIVISLGYEEFLIPFLPSKWNTSFSAEKAYLKVGCFRGLGRSMSKWVLARGAPKFIFMARSGTDMASAQRLVDDLKASGALVTVVRGNVINLIDVKRAVAGIDNSVGGVVQAAMGFMPRIQGSWNLHNAFKGKDHYLEFFLMTFLGLAATSVGIGMVSEIGCLHENPEIEAILLRKRIHSINEDEMLQIIDIAISMPTDIPGGYDELARGHILTGLEPLGLKEL
ncbi:hypothetical protein F5Y19DRAFT_477822 [Xylariaceae sp. FL1651]|nr:hypothetical protein F5Y19DRAFT_477822 [Xylariaceae sp. FL1651]